MVILLTLSNATVAMSLTTSHRQDKAATLAQIEAKTRNFMALGHYDGAKILLDKHLRWPYQRESVPLLKMRAELYRHIGNFVSEAECYQHILQWQPNDKDSLRGRAFAVLKMGAPNLADLYAKQNPDIFSQPELLSFQQASVGRSIKWGTLESKAGLGQQRFQATDQALRRNEMVRSHHLRQHKNDSSSGHYTEFDRLVALRDRFRMNEVIDLYQMIASQNRYIPAYALAAVADAYLYQRQPEIARDLYRQALELSKNDRDYPYREWQMKLFEAYIDTNEFTAARELIDQLVADIPPTLNQGLRGVEEDNENYEEARINQVYARIYADQYKEGQTLLDAGFKSAPFNTGIRLAYGDLLQFREQPRAAQRQYASVLIDDPGNYSAAAGIAETAITLNDVETAQHRLNTLTRFYPENREVQRLQQLFYAYRQPLLTVTSGWGESPTGGGRRGTQDWQVDTMLHSPLLRQNWRAFAHTFNGEAQFTDATGRRRRVGIGADYRTTAWWASGEINQDQTRFDDYGVSLNTAWIPNDHWQLDLAYESNSNDIPLQASAVDISMQSVKLGLNYFANESRSISSSISYSWFTDSNRRVEAGINWQERWWSSPVYKMDTTLAVAASDNSLTTAGYFNPRQDLAIEAQINNEWTLWRDYRRNFKNRLLLGTGNYWQNGFASGMTHRVRYEHEWNLGPYRTISYGAAYERHPYDGEQNETTSVFLNLSWHL